MSENNKPRKPWYRLRNVVLAILLLAVVVAGWVLQQMWLVYTSEPNPTVDSRAQLRQLAEETTGVVPTRADHAWSKFVEAAEMLARYEEESAARMVEQGFEPRDEYDDGSLDFARVMYGQTLPSDVQRERLAIDALRERGLFELLDEFVEFSPGLRPMHGEGSLHADFMVVVTEGARARSLAKMLGASMRFSLADGRIDDLTADFERLLALARTMSCQPFMISHLGGSGIDAFAQGEIRCALMEANLSEPTCRRLMDSLDRHRLADIRFAIEANRIFFHDSLQWTYSDEGDGYLVRAPDAPGFTSPTHIGFFGAFESRFILPTGAELRERYDDCIDQTLDELKLAHVDRWRGTFDPERYADQLPSDYELVAIDVSILRKFVDQSSLDEQRLAATRLMLAMEIHEARHGRLPGSLAELVPDILPELPLNPMNVEPFGYRLFEDDAHGRPYIIYAPDDNARYNPQDPTHTTFPDLPGMFRVFNPPREEWEYWTGQTE